MSDGIFGSSPPPPPRSRPNKSMMLSRNSDVGGGVRIIKKATPEPAASQEPVVTQPTVEVQRFLSMPCANRFISIVEITPESRRREWEQHRARTAGRIVSTELDLSISDRQQLRTQLEEEIEFFRTASRSICATPFLALTSALEDTVESATQVLGLEAGAISVSGDIANTLDAALTDVLLCNLVSKMASRWEIPAPELQKLLDKHVFSARGPAG